MPINIHIVSPEKLHPNQKQLAETFVRYTGRSSEVPEDPTQKTVFWNDMYKLFISETEHSAKQANMPLPDKEQILTDSMARERWRALFMHAHTRCDDRDDD